MGVLDEAERKVALCVVKLRSGVVRGRRGRHEEGSKAEQAHPMRVSLFEIPEVVPG